MTTDSWLPIATLVLGYIGRIAQEWLRDRRADAKERRRRREDFERDALVELQDVLFSLARNCGAAYHQDAMTYRASGTWGRAQLPAELDQEHFTLNRRAGMLRERAFDPALRDLIDEFKSHVAACGIARDKSTADVEMDLMGKASDRANRRLGELLRALY